jgi:purine-binding chemotaxis protein CheW
MSTARQFLTFRLGQEQLAIDLLRVRQIIEYLPPTRVPHLPEAVRGVINLRGTVLPVIDLASRFGLPPQPVTRRTCIVVTETRSAGLLGVIADQVLTALELQPADVVPAPEFGTLVKAEWLVGLARIDDRFVLLLDAEKVLAPQELLAAAGAAAAAGPGAT